MAATNLRQVLFITSSYLDFLSVVEGIRDVGLVKLGTYPVTMIEGKSIAIHTLPLTTQKQLLRSFLSSRYPNHILVPWTETSLFVARKDKMTRVKEFIREHPIPNREYHAALGSLLGYPDCCIQAFLTYIPKKQFSPPRIIPFIPCSVKCEKRWTVAYATLMEKYGIENTEFNVWL